MVTSGIFYCREGAEISDCSTFKTSYRADSLVLRNRQLLIAAAR